MDGRVNESTFTNHVRVPTQISKQQVRVQINRTSVSIILCSVAVKKTTIALNGLIISTDWSMPLFTCQTIYVEQCVVISWLIGFMLSKSLIGATRIAQAWLLTFTHIYMGRRIYILICIYEHKHARILIYTHAYRVEHIYEKRNTRPRL